MEISASSLPSMESSQSSGIWTYRITIKYHESVHRSYHLIRRHWIVTYASGHQDFVSGEGVVGHFPILNAATPTFSYCSICTGREKAPGVDDYAISMEGHFEFAIGNGTTASDVIIRVRINRFLFQQCSRLMVLESNVGGAALIKWAWINGCDAIKSFSRHCREHYHYLESLLLKSLL